MLGRALACIMLMAWFVPVAHAGTQQAPEVRDPVGDADIYPGAPAGALGGPVDFDAVWIGEETAKEVTLSVHVADLSSLTREAANPEFSIDLSASFTTSNDALRCGSWQASGYFHGGPGAVWRFFLFPRDEDCKVDQADLKGSADADAGVISIQLPRALLQGPQPGDNLTLSRVDLWSGFPYPLDPSDRWDAPRDGDGVPFVFQAAGVHADGEPFVAPAATSSSSPAAHDAPLPALVALVGCALALALRRR